LRIIRGVLLKGNGWSEIMPEVWPMAVFMLVVIAIGLRSFRSTLD
jgi:ABC-2 type transport system permease protein